MLVQVVARVIEHGADRVFEGLGGRVVRNIVLAGAPQHLDHVGNPGVHVVLREGETGSCAARRAR